MCIVMAEFFSTPAHIIYQQCSQCVHTTVSVSERIPLCVSYIILDGEGNGLEGTLAKISVPDTVNNMDTHWYTRILYKISELCKSKMTLEKQRRGNVWM